jgi:hypothetical protein
VTSAKRNALGTLFFHVAEQVLRRSAERRVVELERRLGQ